MTDNDEKMRAIKYFLLGGSILLALSLTCFYFGVGIVRSGSMEPAIMTNDLVLVRRFGDLREGDIVVYESQGKRIIHRIVEMDGDRLVTKGDANNVADDPIDISQVKGIVIGRIPNMPYARDIAQVLQAKFITSASGTSRAGVARWDVSALTDMPDTLQIISGTDDFSDGGYEFSVNSNSDTTAEYHIIIDLSCEDDDSQSGGLTLGLMKYDEDREKWFQVSESSSGEIEYGGTFPLGCSSDRFMLKVKADEEAAGSYAAHVVAEVVQID